MAAIVARTLAEGEIDAAGRTLADAFHDDPLQRHVFPDAKERARRAPAQFALMLREAMTFGTVVAADGVRGVTAWIKPAGDPSVAGGASVMHRLPEAMGTEACARFGGVLDHVSKIHGAGAPQRHWYLMAIGVAPEARGRGLGEVLLAAVFRLADSQGLPICLDTPQPKVRPFYERLGFRQTIESVDPISSLRFWTFQRDPVR